MTINRKTLRWDGWGETAYRDPLARNDAAWDWLAGLMGMEALPYTNAVPFERLEIPATRIPETDLETLRGQFGADNVRTDAYERLFHARGRGYLDLLELRAGHLEALPDAVLYPGNPIEVLEILRLADRQGYAVVPFGGGSSAVGGVNAHLPAGANAVITLDITRMNRVMAVDDQARTAVVEAGIYGPELEKQLAEHGFTLGHYPQSFEFSTLGGWIAARGSGQQSRRYGNPSKWLVGAKLVAPAGIWETECFPASAAGPSLTDLVVGSEGHLGIITGATIRVHPLPEDRDYRGYLVKTFEEGVEIVRTLSQSDIPIAMMRLSDPEETDFMRVYSQVGRRKDPQKLGYFERRRLKSAKFPDKPCLLLIGLEGSADSVSWARARIQPLMKKHKALSLGRKAGQDWLNRRFAAPYARDPMLDRGLGIDSVETATRWSNIHHLQAEVKAAIEDAVSQTMPRDGAQGLVMSHVSHAYPDGANLHFQFIFPRYPGYEVEQWQLIKKSASEAIVEHGGTISHNQGVGVDHAPWIMEEKGPAGVNILRAVKQTLDPSSTLNAGKLLPD